MPTRTPPGPNKNQLKSQFKNQFKNQIQNQKRKSLATLSRRRPKNFADAVRSVLALAVIFLAAGHFNPFTSSLGEDANVGFVNEAWANADAAHLHFAVASPERGPAVIEPVCLPDANAERGQSQRIQPGLTPGISGPADRERLRPRANSPPAHLNC